VIDLADGPGQVIASACGSLSSTPQFEPVGQVVRCGVDADSSLVGARIIIAAV